MSDIRITVNVFANLRDYTGGKPTVELEVQPGQTIAQVLDRLGIPREQTRIIFVDGRSAGIDQPLEGGERVDLFSPIGGG